MAVRREDELDSAKQGPDAKENLEDHGQTPECREATGYRSWPRGRSGNADRGCHLITSDEFAPCHVCRGRRGEPSGSSRFPSSYLVGSTRSTTMLLSVTSAATAPTAASHGARTAPASPTVSGSSTIVCSPCLMLIRRTFPSLMSRLSSASRRSTSILNCSVRVFSCVCAVMTSSFPG